MDFEDTRTTNPILDYPKKKLTNQFRLIIIHNLYFFTSKFYFVEPGPFYQRLMNNHIPLKYQI